MFKPTRPPYGYTPELIQNALVVLNEMSDSDIKVVCDHIAKNRGHPALNGMNTERLLPQFGNIMNSLSETA